MKIKVVRDAVPPLRYADIEVGEAFVYAACPSSVFIRTSAGVLRLHDFEQLSGQGPDASVVRVLMTITWTGPS